MLGVTVPLALTGVPGFSSTIGGVGVPALLEAFGVVNRLGVPALLTPKTELGVLDLGGIPTKLLGVLVFLGAGLELNGILGVPGLARGMECVESVLAGRGSSTVTAVTLRSGRFSVRDVGDWVPPSGLLTVVTGALYAAVFTKVVMVVAALAIRGLGSLTRASWGCPGITGCPTKLAPPTLLPKVFRFCCINPGGVSSLLFLTSIQTGVPTTGVPFLFGDVGCPLSLDLFELTPRSRGCV